MNFKLSRIQFVFKFIRVCTCVVYSGFKVIREAQFFLPLTALKNIPLKITPLRLLNCSVKINTLIDKQ